MTAELEYIKPGDFDRALLKEVDREYFLKDPTKPISEKGNLELYLKTLFFFFLLGFSYWIIVFSYWHWIFKLWAGFTLGLSFCGIGMGVAHDASHDAYSKHQWVNDLLSHSFNLIGVDCFIWWMKHVILHHLAANYDGIDDDTDIWPIFRIYLKDKKLAFHKYQHIYCLWLYPTLVFVWIFWLDTQKWWNRRVGKTPFKDWKTGWYDARFLLTKVWHVYAYIYLPIHHNGWLIGISIYVIAIGIAGFVLSSVFQCAHLSAGIPVHEAEEKKPKRARLQLIETTDFAQKNRVLGWFAGGLNFQTEHHLFPHISHVHYPYIAPIVESFVQRFNEQKCEPPIPYRKIKTFKRALKNHRIFMKMRAAA